MAYGHGRAISSELREPVNSAGKHQRNATQRTNKRTSTQRQRQRQQTDRQVGADTLTHNRRDLGV